MPSPKPSNRSPLTSPSSSNRRCPPWLESPAVRDLKALFDNLTVLLSTVRTQAHPYDDNNQNAHRLIPYIRRACPEDRGVALRYLWITSLGAVEWELHHLIKTIRVMATEGIFSGAVDDVYVTEDEKLAWSWAEQNPVFSDVPTLVTGVYLVDIEVVGEGHWVREAVIGVGKCRRSKRVLGVLKGMVARVTGWKWKVDLNGMGVDELGGGEKSGEDGKERERREERLDSHQDGQGKRGGNGGGVLASRSSADADEEVEEKGKEDISPTNTRFIDPAGLQ